MRPARHRRRRPRPLGLACILGGMLVSALLVASLGLLSDAARAPSASALAPFPPAEATTPQADGSVPASGVTMIGATPEESGAPGSNETWGVGKRGTKTVLVRYVEAGDEGSWGYGPALPSGFNLDEAPLAAAMTPRGAGAMLGTVSGSSGSEQALLVRAAGQPFVQAPLPSGEESLLGAKEELFPASKEGQEPMVAALEEENGETGALVVPVVATSEEHVGDRVLHWDGKGWSEEKIEVPGSLTDFRVLAIAASGPGNAWLLAQLAAHKGGLGLFRRVEESPGHWVWKPVSLEGGKASEPQPLTVPVQSGSEPRLTVSGTGDPPTPKAQLLAVTQHGVWVAGGRADLSGSEGAGTLLYLTPEGEVDAKLTASWCEKPGELPACTGELPEALTGGYSRMIAWPGGGGSEPYGRLVVTGLREGVSLRLQGTAFTTVLSFGGGATAEDDPGAQLGAAFSDPTDGWLGRSLLPIQLTPHPAASRLAPWPVTFRHPLYAIAPQPEAPVGSRSSEALAVGADGEVARYKPSEGWVPESLFGPGERVERGVQLRSVAWPRASRAYAVGDEGQMWLYRAEIGRWERDPATPINLRANLLGVAFQPGEPSRGYAVGTDQIGLGGVILRYGKTWTEESELPVQVQDAAFTSVAFAGSEALATYRRQPNPNVSVFTGGILVNDGSGWHVEELATNALEGAVPVAVAGLPDGGAAFIAEGGAGGRTVFERQAPGAPWQAVPVPTVDKGGSLALFREGSSLRAIIAGGGVGNLVLQPSLPSGYPPRLYEPISSESPGVETAIVLRQTAAGWSDESHEMDPTQKPEGNYQPYFDFPYRPDPIQAVMVNETGSEGWAVGGAIGPKSESELADTSDVERYPAESATPPGREVGTVPLHEVEKTWEEARLEEPLCKGSCASFAVGGHGVCEDPCAARARTGVGPVVWLAEALRLASRIGVGSFLYTGPSIAAGRTLTTATVPYPYAREYELAARIFGESPLASYVAVSPQDRAGRPESEGSESMFVQKLSGHLNATELSERGACVSEDHCQGAYYALTGQQQAGLKEQNGVRVLFLDESLREADPAQVEWVQRELAEAQSQKEAAIAVGDAKLAGESWAKPLIAALVGGEGCKPTAASSCASASAYFYDAPEEDVTGTLQAGAGSIPEFGSGTLGYEQARNESKSDFHGASGILLAQVELGGGRVQAATVKQTNRYPVMVRLEPVVGELGLEAKSGALLQRSHPVVFSGLARRPRAGGDGEEDSSQSSTAPYVPIPEECVGSACAGGIFPEYSFKSSNEEVGAFVKRNTESGSSLAVLQNAKGEPIRDEHSGLFCPFNQGETTITLETGGLKSSLRVVVQKGSVREPCGTVPLKEHKPTVEKGVEAPPPGESPEPAGATGSTPPLVPLPPAPALPTVHPAAPASPFIPLASLGAPPLAFVPPPIPTPARPTPPSGTSAVTSPIEVAEEEDEEEGATEQASNQAVAYRAPEHEPTPLYILGVVLLAAFAGAAIRRPRKGDRDVKVAYASLNSIRSQRHATRASRRRGRQ